jgi:uncharacterized protein YyaL (SSP411 family)
VNRLATETSPYLRQHAGNPVHWWPWCDEAFAEARRRDVPVLLSVGYSACHWCHVMAHESFEDPATAAVMNQHFVNIKVDREERPDVDGLYMEAVQALTGHGGWPMTVFLTPGGEVLHAGTYFPPEPRHGMPSFTQVLAAVARAWRGEERAELEERAARITEALARTARMAAGQRPGPEVLETATARLVERLDRRHGGFGPAPKFPSPSVLDLLLRRHVTTGDPAPAEAVTLTLDRMAAGGLYDHLGGGFARYSTDERWLVPHFEKMLYDNAQLVQLYARAWQVTGRDRYRQVVAETVAYLMRDLALAGGGFASAEDADSEGAEGRFYLWTAGEVRAVLGPELAPAAMAWWGVTEAGNFEGANVLHRPGGVELARPPEVEQARRLLFEHRARRVRPGLDDKVLTEWNALAVSALAEAGAAFDQPAWIDAARACARFLLDRLRGPGGRWLRSWQADGGARHLAYAEDHAALVDAFTRLAEATGEAAWYDHALATADTLVELFWDPDGGGLATTGADAPALLVRRKDVVDGATPSANATAALALARLAALSGRSDWDQRAEALLGLVGPAMGSQPQAFARMLAALELHLARPVEVVVAGERPDLVAEVRRRFLPHAVVAWGQPTASPLWEGRRAGWAYVCRGQVCHQPVEDPEALARQLDALHPR